jgi:hypothetical protein
MDNPVVRNLVTLAAVFLSIAGVWLVRRFVPQERLRESNEFSGFTYAFLGVVYGVYLAFMIVVVWERFDQADTNTTAEAAHLLALWRDVAPLPNGAAVQAHVVRFTNSIVHDDWPEIGRGRPESAATSRAFGELWQSMKVLQTDATDARQSAWFEAAVGEMNDIALARTKRIMSGAGTLPVPMWLLLVGGGISMVAFTYLIGADNARVQMVATAILTALLCYSILMVAALEHPFAGDVSVSPEAFENVLRSMH